MLGETLDLGLTDRMMAASGVALLIGASFWSMTGGVHWWYGVASTASKTAGLDDIAQQSLGGGSVLMGKRRAVVLFGVVAV